MAAFVLLMGYAMVVNANDNCKVLDPDLVQGNETGQAQIVFPSSQSHTNLASLLPHHLVVATVYNPASIIILKYCGKPIG